MKSIDFPCGGKGICGGCAVCLSDRAPLPTPADRRHLTPGQLRQGYRLACRLPEGFLLEPGTARKEPSTVFSGALEPSGISLPLPRDVLAIDLGTTTIAMTLYGRRDAKVLKNHSVLNPQRVFGADVLSRLQAAEEGEAEKLKSLVREALLRGIRAINPDINNSCIYLAGNTAMLHLLMGYPTETLSRAPFHPYSIAVDTIQLEEYSISILPGLSAFVGADVFSDLYGLLQNDNERFLLVDLGTNGEIAYGSRKHFTCTATAAGCAFEGGASAGVFGADLVGALAGLLREGILDSTGLLKDPYFEEGVRIGTKDAVFLLTQRDIRRLQEAKAAIAAGIRLLTEGKEGPDKVYLAGGFGYYLKPEDAARIGLIPEEYVPLCVVPGNAVLTGLLAYASDGGRREGELLVHGEVINLAMQESFEERYIANLDFPA